MRRALLCTFFLLANVAFAADDHPTFTLWPEGKTPGAVGSGQGHEPTLTVWLPADGKGNGAAVIIATVVGATLGLLLTPTTVEPAA